MQPASDSGDRPGGFDWRRIAPVAVIGVLIVGVIVFVVGGGDDDEPTASDDRSSQEDTSTTDGSDSAPDVEPPTGAVSFSRAEADELDVTFEDTCDLETGRVAMPYFFASECYANVDDNGGATHTGVTADTVTVVVYIGPDADPVLDFITAPIANDDTGDEVAATYQGYTDLFNEMYQTYGRTVELKFLRGSGISTDAVSARADAVKAVEELGAFAAWGGPALSNAWTDELAARGVLCLGCPGGAQEWHEQRAPFTYAITAQGYQTHIHLTEYVSKKLLGKPAAYAGDPAFQETERVIADVYLRSSEESDKSAEALSDRFADAGVDLREQLNYNLDNPSLLGEQATNIISKLKAAGVTTVIFRGDPVAPGALTREATNQEYFPEWVLGGSALVDVTAFGRTFDQQQWAHAFGISSLTVRTPPSFTLYEWFHGTEPPAPDTNGVLFPQPALFFAGLQAAGPVLTPESFRDGLFSLEPPLASPITNPLITYGDHDIWSETDWNGIDDFTELWWDPDATGPDELRKDGQGMYVYVDGGRRYLPGQWTDELAVFNADRGVALLDGPPENEAPKDYPPRN